MTAAWAAVEGQRAAEFRSPGSCAPSTSVRVTARDRPERRFKPVAARLTPAPTGTPARPPAAPPMAEAAVFLPSHSVRVPRRNWSSWVTASMKTSSATSSATSLPTWVARARRPAAVVTDRAAVTPTWRAAAFIAAWVANRRPAICTSLEMIWLIAARRPAMMPPAAPSEAPKVKKAINTEAKRAAMAIQNATLMEILEYCVSRAKESVCWA
ncbi:hypothetical protein [Modestobacter sp. Leaf380]|uniref:hypothetical protein n=1 Tax=Modestobacter sp. Leaf380 TaxID=1736356 RepID=UPI0012FBFCDE|nr:hypothetical protein [Modestobacter sp. Leaf380]